MNITLKENDWICDECRLQIVKSVGAQRKRDQVCCNPLSFPAHDVKKKLREINSTDLVKKAKQMNITVEIGQLLCGKCRLQLLHSSKPSDAQEVVANLEMEQSVEDSSTSATEAEEDDASLEYTDKNDVLIALDNLLKTLSLKPINQTKLKNKFQQSKMFEELKVKLLNVIFTKVSDHQNEMIEQMK